jgi:DNA-binding NtrC family response regulator
MSSKRILIVDDDSSVVRILGRIFTREGFTVTTCHNGAQAVEPLSTQTFDAMICDVQMPRLSGPELVRQVTSAGVRLPTCTFIITSRSEDEQRDWVSAYPEIELVEKPVGPKQLLRLVTRRLQLPAPQAESPGAKGVPGAGEERRAA